MTALATPADLIKRCDVRTLGDLAGDAGVRVGASELLTHANIQAALDDAWGEILAVLRSTDRYRELDLTALTGDTKQYLIRVCCKIAKKNLYERREWTGDDDEREDAIAAGRTALEEMRNGKKVLTTAAAEAGLPSISTPTVHSIARQNLTVDRARAGYYLRRVLPRNF